MISPTVGVEQLKTRALIIGGGVTGAGILRDLALRGVDCLLLERRDLAAGASGGNHGLLHSGARYASQDRKAAIECREEGTILKQVAPHAIEDVGGLFVAVAGDDEAFAADFPEMCRESGIPVRSVEPKEAREMEPGLSEKIIAAYAVPDASVDPFMLTRDNVAHAQAHGAGYKVQCRVTGFELSGGRISAVLATDEALGRQMRIEADLVINAAGAWAGLISAMAGIELKILYSKGTLLVTQDRLATRVVNRLRHAADADILVPGGSVSILGTTSVRIDSPDACRPTVAEAERIIDDAADMMPVLAESRYIRSYAGVRPLFSFSSATDDRSVSRGFALLDHAADGIENFLTITGGKLTTYRLMAEKSSDMACAKLGVDAPCLTATETLPASDLGRWTDPRSAAKSWTSFTGRGKVVLCECELVPAGVVEEVSKLIRHEPGDRLMAISRGSRVGKGPCQGGLCSLRVAAHLYSTGVYKGRQGIGDIIRFIETRFLGTRPIMWGPSLMQSEIQEAMHCGLAGLELIAPEVRGRVEPDPGAAS